jgi:hypothetical protein
MFGALLRQDRERWGFAWRAVAVAQSLPVDFEFTLWDWGRVLLQRRLHRLSHRDQRKIHHLSGTGEAAIERTRLETAPAWSWPHQEKPGGAG